MQPGKSCIFFVRSISLQPYLSTLRALFFQIVLLLFLANSLQAAAIFDPSASTITGGEARSLGAKENQQLLYLGDIILYPTDDNRFAVGGELWTNGTLIYQFFPELEESKKQAFQDACQAWTLNSSSVVCQERTTEANFVLVIEHDGSGCGGDAENVSCSALGMVGGSQNLEVYQDHWASTLKLQEQIGHAFGLIHEHNRKDRNAFVGIVEDNILSGQEGHFETQHSSFSTDYDLRSVMHNNNCSFSKHTNCTIGDKDSYTIVPVSCHMDEIGGTAITVLDYDSLKSAYASPLYLLFPRERTQRCGVLDYSVKQVKETCGPDCDALGEVQDEKAETKEDSWCGAVPDFEFQHYCSPGKTYTDHQWELDYFSCGWLEVRSDLLVQCGCPHQSILAQCVNTAGPVNLDQLQGLLESGIPRDLNAGRFVKRVLDIQKKGNLGTEVYAKMGDFLIDNYNHRGFAKSIKNLTCLVKIFMAGKLVVNPSYKLTLSSFRNLANQTGLRTNSL